MLSHRVPGQLCLWVGIVLVKPPGGVRDLPSQRIRSTASCFPQPGLSLSLKNKAMTCLVFLGGDSRCVKRIHNFSHPMEGAFQAFCGCLF